MKYDHICWKSVKVSDINMPHTSLIQQIWVKLNDLYLLCRVFFFSPSFGTCMTIGLYIISEILMERRIRMTMRYDRMKTLGFTF